MGRIVINGNVIDITDGANVNISSRNGSISITSAANGVSIHSSNGYQGTVSLKIEGVVANISADGAVNCNAVTGDVRCGGSFNGDNVEGNVMAGGSVNCDKVGGNLSAGGSVRCTK